ncbi:hypothetical protein Ahia01_001096300 [Argonauta hians]
MGNWISETLEKAEMEEAAPTPAVLSLHQRYSIDPRSPSNFINRTPILLCNKPNVSIDPRSPSTEINRTPLFCSLHRANEMTPMAQMQRTSTAAVADDDGVAADDAAIMESMPAAEESATTAASLTDHIKPLCLDGAFNNEEDEEDDSEEEEVVEEERGVSRHLSKDKVVDDIPADRLTTEKEEKEEEEVEEKDVEEEDEENHEEPQCRIATDSDSDPDPEDIPTISDISDLLDLTAAMDVEQPGRLAMLDISDYPAVGVGSEAGAGEEVDRHDGPAVLSFSDRLVVEPLEAEQQSRPVILELTDDLTTPGAVFKEEEDEEEKMMKPNDENLAKTSYIDGSAADSDDASIGDYSNSSSSDGSYSCSGDCSNGSSLCGSIDSSSVGGGSSSDGVVVVDDVIGEILLRASKPDDGGCSTAADDDDDDTSSTTTTTTAAAVATITATTTTSSNTTTTTVTADPIIGSPEDQHGVRDRERRNKGSGIPLAVKKSSSVSDLGTSASTLTSDGERKPASLLRLLPKQQSLLQRPASTTAIINSSSNKNNNKGGNLRYKNRRGMGSGCVAGSRSPLQSRNCMGGGRVAGHGKRSGLAKGRMATSSSPWAMGAVEPTQAVDKENLSVQLH